MTIEKHKDRGQVGIGTLIVFIAMVLVAAIAAGVLVNTAGVLQGQAEATGEESQDQISDNINIVSSSLVTSEHSDEHEGDDGLVLGVQRSAGANPVDVNQSTINIVGEEEHYTIETELGEDPAQIQPGDGHFGIATSLENVFEEDDSYVGNNDDSVLGADHERLYIVIDEANFEEDARNEIRLVQQSGAVTTHVVEIPDYDNIEDVAPVEV